MQAPGSVALVGTAAVIVALLSTGQAGAQSTTTITTPTVTLPVTTTTSTTAPSSTTSTPTTSTTSTLKPTTTTAAPTQTPSTVMGTTTTTGKPTPPPARRWQASAGKFRTRSSAQTRQRRVAARGFKGYVIERERGPRFDVERTFPTRAAANAEAARLRRAGFRATVEAA